MKKIKLNSLVIFVTMKLPPNTIQKDIHTCHKETVENIIKFSCDFCNHEATSKYNLERHINTCHEETVENIIKITCDICNYETTSKYNLERHKTSHKDKDNIECEICGFVTSKKTELNKHVRTIHTKKPKLVCDQCEYETDDRKYLTRHKKRKHTQISTAINNILVWAPVPHFDSEWSKKHQQLLVVDCCLFIINNFLTNLLCEDSLFLFLCHSCCCLLFYQITVHSILLCHINMFTLLGKGSIKNKYIWSIWGAGRRGQGFLAKSNMLAYILS